MRPTPRRRTHAGTHRRQAQAQQAANIVRSIREHQARGITRTPADYQVSGDVLRVVEQLLQAAEETSVALAAYDDIMRGGAAMDDGRTRAEAAAPRQDDTTTWTAAHWLAYAADCDRRGSYLIRDCAYAQAQKLLETQQTA